VHVRVRIGVLSVMPRRAEPMAGVPQFPSVMTLGNFPRQIDA